MRITPQSQATLLLTVSFGKTDPADTKALSIGEWARFAAWLRDHKLDPASLMHGDLSSLLSGLVDRTINIPRVQKLLNRGPALGLALEKWERAGLWAITRSDPTYPGRLKKLLRTSSPPVLFGCGNIDLLNSGGIAVVGSRDASEEDLQFSRTLGHEAASQGYSIVSGGARGIDETAMTGALDHEGTVVGILADSLLRSATSSRYRKALQTGDLVLVSPFNPEAVFNAGNAMARNRYIYCLSDAAIVVCSTESKGGTWNGAIEALKHQWVPVWTKPSSDPLSGNLRLLQIGANEIKDETKKLSSLTTPPTKETSNNKIFDEKINHDNNVKLKDSAIDQSAQEKQNERGDLIKFLEQLSLAGPMNISDICSHLNEKKTKISSLIKEGISKGLIIKLNNPIRYEARTPTVDQISFLI